MGSKPNLISGSRAASILNMNNWQTSLEVWQLIMEERQPGFNKSHGYILPEFNETAVIRFGTAFENANIKITENVLKKNITKREHQFKKDFLTCHVDGIIDNKILFEGKTTSSFYFRNNFGEPGLNKLPRNYQIQIQHNLNVAGLEKAIVAVLIFPEMADKWEEMGWTATEQKLFTSEARENYPKISTKPYKWAQVLYQMGFWTTYHIQRNQELIDLMIEKYIAFWHNHILTGIPPEPKNYDDIKRLYNQPKGTIVASDQVERWCFEFKEIGEELGAKGILKKRREQLKVMILNWMRQQDSCIDDDSRERTILRNSRGHKLIGFNGKMLR